METVFVFDSLWMLESRPSTTSRTPGAADPGIRYS
jgi:hypothetical protein